VHLWSGRLPDGMPAATGWERLVAGCAELLSEADALGVPLAFEPEPGMLVEGIDDWRRLAGALGDHPRFGITLDLGHCLCVEDRTVAECVADVADLQIHVQIEDIRRGVHEHLMFGEGDLDLPGALEALGDARYQGLVAVELSRHSHTAHTTVPDSIAHLRRAEQTAVAREPAA
jgi:sugar phosphate isomerase/epimerase